MSGPATRRGLYYFFAIEFVLAGFIMLVSVMAGLLLLLIGGAMLLVLWVWDHHPEWIPKRWHAALALLLPPEGSSTPAAMPSIKELSEKDFPECLRISSSWRFDDAQVEAKVHLCINTHSHSKFLLVYLPRTKDAYHLIRDMADQSRTVASQLEGEIGVFYKIPGDRVEMDMASIPFVNRVLVYHEDSLSLQEQADLDSHYRDLGLSLTLRGSDYATTKWLSYRR